jgi:hypothetical protein
MNVTLPAAVQDGGFYDTHFANRAFFATAFCDDIGFFNEFHWFVTLNASVGVFSSFEPGFKSFEFFCGIYHFLHLLIISST